MQMRVDKTWYGRHARGSDTKRMQWDFHGFGATCRSDATAADKDHSVFDRWTAAAIDETHSGEREGAI